MNNQKKYHLFDVLIYAILLALAFLFQSTSILFKYNSPAPSLVLALVLIISFYENYWFSAIFGLISGILLDIISVNGVGFHALTYMLTGIICSSVMKRYLQNNFASFAVISIPVIIIHQFAEILYSSGFDLGIITLFLKYYLIVAIYTFASAFVLYIIFRYTLKRSERFVKPKGIINKK